MFYRLFSYFKFILKSTNQHGVHSPFVYDFLTKGLYKKVDSNIRLNTFNSLEKLSKKEKNTLKKIIKYFNPTSIIINLKDSSNTLNKDHNLLIYSYLSEKNILTLSLKKPNSFIIIKNIHNNELSEKNWIKIIQLKEVKVTIDLFYFGLIFFRKKQAKEHFNIRS